MCRILTRLKINEFSAWGLRQTSGLQTNVISRYKIHIEDQKQHVFSRLKELGIAKKQTMEQLKPGWTIPQHSWIQVVFDTSICDELLWAIYWTNTLSCLNQVMYRNVLLTLIFVQISFGTMCIHVLEQGYHKAQSLLLNSLTSHCLTARYVAIPESWADSRRGRKKYWIVVPIAASDGVAQMKILFDLRYMSTGSSQLLRSFVDRTRILFDLKWNPGQWLGVSRLCNQGLYAESSVYISLILFLCKK